MLRRNVMTESFKVYTKLLSNIYIKLIFCEAYNEKQYKFEILLLIVR